MCKLVTPQIETQLLQSAISWLLQNKRKTWLLWDAWHSMWKGFSWCFLGKGWKWAMKWSHLWEKVKMLSRKLARDQKNPFLFYHMSRRDGGESGSLPVLWELFPLNTAAGWFSLFVVVFWSFRSIFFMLKAVYHIRTNNLPPPPSRNKGQNDFRVENGAIFLSPYKSVYTESQAKMMWDGGLRNPKLSSDCLRGLTSSTCIWFITSARPSVSAYNPFLSWLFFDLSF